MRRKALISIIIISMCISFVACGGSGMNLDSDTKKLERNKSVEYCFGDTVIGDKDYDEEKINVALTDFALRMFQKDIEMEQDLGQKDKNVLISPTSIITALGMTTYGAKDDTLTQMETVFGMSRGHLNYYNYEYMSNVSEELKIANSIWLKNDERLTVKDDFLQFNEEFYGADIYETAFNSATVQEINNWVEQNTDGTIKEILNEIPEDAVMYLINALTFEAEWEEKYKETDIIKNQVFTMSNGEEQKVDMMSSNENLYLEDENATGFVKYYKDRNYAFVALLPNEDISVCDYAKSLTGEHLQELLANSSETRVDVQIPQFSYEYEVEMSSLLKEMGMVDAFDWEKADFTNMATSSTGNVFINRVLHKTYIEVTPVGTKAGATTAVEMNLLGAPLIKANVYLDRPFLYMIIDCDSNQPIFMGTVNSIE